MIFIFRRMERAIGGWTGAEEEEEEMCVENSPRFFGRGRFRRDVFLGLNGWVAWVASIMNVECETGRIIFSSLYAIYP